MLNGWFDRAIDTIQRFSVVINDVCVHCFVRAEEPASPSPGGCWLNMICLLAQLLLHALLAVLLYWLLYYRWDGPGLVPFHWLGGDVRLEWSLHPLMMVLGSVYCVGQGMLMYTCSSCCLPCCSTLFHVVFPLVSLPCLVVGLLSAWHLDAVTSSHLVTMHSWCGAITVLLILSQVNTLLSSLLELLPGLKECKNYDSKFEKSLKSIYLNRV